MTKNKEKAGKLITSRLKYCGADDGMPSIVQNSFCVIPISLSLSLMIFAICLPSIISPQNKIQKNSMKFNLGVDIVELLCYIQFAIEKHSNEFSPH